MIVGIAVETTVDSKEARAVTRISATVTAARRPGSKRGAVTGSDTNLDHLTGLVVRGLTAPSPRARFTVASHAPVQPRAARRRLALARGGLRRLRGAAAGAAAATAHRHGGHGRDRRGARERG